MPDFISGEPGLIQPNLPPLVAISSSTNATPIVVTTAADHNLKTGEFLYIAKANDPAANGVFRAGAVTATTVALLHPDTGANIAGTLVGGAQGILINAGFGTEFSIPVDITDPRDAASVNVGFEALAARTAFLLYWFQYGRPRRRTRITLTDADQTIDVGQGCLFLLPSAPAATRIIKLRTTTAPIPEEGEWLELVAPNLAAGHQYDIAREDGSLICELYGLATADQAVSAKFDFSLGNWRLGLNSGGGADGTAGGFDGVRSRAFA